MQESSDLCTQNLLQFFSLWKKKKKSLLSLFDSLTIRGSHSIFGWNMGTRAPVKLTSSRCAHTRMALGFLLRLVRWSFGAPNWNRRVTTNFGGPTHSLWTSVLECLAQHAIDICGLTPIQPPFPSHGAAGCECDFIAPAQPLASISQGCFLCSTSTSTKPHATPVQQVNCWMFLRCCSYAKTVHVFIRLAFKGWGIGFLPQWAEAENEYELFHAVLCFMLVSKTLSRQQWFHLSCEGNFYKQKG